MTDPRFDHARTPPYSLDAEQAFTQLAHCEFRKIINLASVCLPLFFGKLPM